MLRSHVPLKVTSPPIKKNGLFFDYVDNPQDFEQTNYHFKKFRQKLQYKYSNNPFPYLCVPEFQKNANVHYHMLADLPFIPVCELSETWSAGFVKINELSTITNVGAYVSKYLTKSELLSDNINKKSFFHSLDLARPLEITESATGGMALNVEKTFDYISDYFGKVHLTINKILEV